MPNDPRIEATHDGDRITARLTDCPRLSAETIDVVARQLAELVRGREKPQLAVDLGGVTFLSSMALTKFISLNATIRAAGGRLSLVNVQPLIREVFTVTRLDQLIDVQPATDGLPA